MRGAVQASSSRRAVETCCPSLTCPGRLSPRTVPAAPAARSIRQSLGLSQDLSSGGEAARNAVILLSFLVFFRVVVYLVLRRKTARM